MSNLSVLLVYPTKAGTAQRYGFGRETSEARQALNEETDAQGATYYHVILMREPGSNGNMHASADIYR